MISAIGVSLVALFFLWMGIAALVLPHRILALFGVAVATVDGRNEVRAVYGGFGIAMGLMLLAAARLPSMRDGMLVCLAIAVAGMACGRVASVAIDRSAGFYPWLFLVIEAVMAATLFAAVLGG